MNRCLQLAVLGAGRVAPNPMVGAVLVYNGRIIGEGFHQQFGQCHAEVNCLNNVQESDTSLIPDSTLYVSLEPCAHFGKTPPCADLIILRGIKTVVVGCRDPFVEVNGRGIEKLQSAGISVISDLLQSECENLNRRFFLFHQKQRPYIILKWAQSANYCIAGEKKEQVRISGELTNRLVHRWRTEEAAIAIGTFTALLDDPKLTARLWPGQQPVRVVVDKDLKISSSAALFSGDVPCIVFNRYRNDQAGNCSFVQIEDSSPVLQQILKHLYKLQILSVIIEGGTIFLQSFIDSGLWDEARIITNTSLVIKNGYAAPLFKDGGLMFTEEIENDLIQVYRNGPSCKMQWK